MDSRELRRYRPFSTEEIHRANQLGETLLRPWRWLTQPLFLGLEHIPRDRPVMLVGNHTLTGVLDAPLMLAEIYKQLGIYVRALGDHAHFDIPGWGHFWHTMGIVDGTRENCARMMAQKEYLIAFPGGAREVFKRRGEQYKLIWGSRMGFARMAIAYGYPIVPFAAVGAEECYDIVVDGNDIARTPLGTVVQKLSGRQDILVPLLKGVGPTPLPKPQRLYFKFSQPIETHRFEGDFERDSACQELRDEVKERIEADIEVLLALRQRDPQRRLWPRLFPPSPAKEHPMALPLPAPAGR
ncbi:MAG: lysophospholipid acyltransferase family protein [Candidatus Competibacterales bacterium]